MKGDTRGSARRVTAADVAARAQVSSTTVGYVLNGTKGQTISAATTRRVLDAARELNYQPLLSAQRLARGASDVVLVILPDWPSSKSFTESLESASALLDEAGFSCVTQVKPPAHHRPAWRSVEPLLVAGLVPFSAAEVRDIKAAGVAHILTLASDEIGDGAEVQAEHLISEGHRVLGYAQSSDQRVASVSSALASSFVRAATEQGLQAPLVRTINLFDDSAAEALRAWRTAGVTAVGCFSDEIAAAVMREAQSVGVRVPDDLAIIGYDDTSLARLVEPAISSISVDASAFGRRMARVVLAAIDGGEVPAVDDSLFSLVVRESSTGGR